MIRIVEFDFERREDRGIGLEELSAALAAGRYCWVDAEAPSGEEAAALFDALALDEQTRREVLAAPEDGHVDVHPDGVHFEIGEPGWADGRIRVAYVDVVLARAFMLTYRQSPLDLIRQMNRVYREDFVRYAESPGFLIYEIGDHLVEAYRRTQERVSGEVERIQQKLFGHADDAIFVDVARLNVDLNILRRTFLGARELLHELATRRSPCISSNTQPYLASMAESISRLQGDLTAERELLNETLNLYLGMVSHRTNRVVSRLTALSAVFLPLTFLCGVYGMNFEVLPELKWPHGYLFFWITAVSLITVLLVLMRRARWF